MTCNGEAIGSVRRRVVPDRDRVPERGNALGAAVDVCSDAPPWAQQAKRAADGGVVDASRALSGSPLAPRIHAQRVARSSRYYACPLVPSVDRCW